MLTTRLETPSSAFKESRICILHKPTGWSICLDSWVDNDFGCSTLCLVLPGLMGSWQKWLSRWARWWNIPNPTQPNPTIWGDGPPCTILNFLDLVLWIGKGYFNNNTYLLWGSLSNNESLSPFRILIRSSNASCQFLLSEFDCTRRSLSVSLAAENRKWVQHW